MTLLRLLHLIIINCWRVLCSTWIDLHRFMRGMVILGSMATKSAGADRDPVVGTRKGATSLRQNDDAPNGARFLDPSTRLSPSADRRARMTEIADRSFPFVVQWKHSGGNMKRQRSGYAMLFLLLFTTTCNAWWQPVPDELQPAKTYQTLLNQQVERPEDPTLSYNLGIAAQQQKKYADAERHFSLATELYDAGDDGRIATYFSWADAAAQQLLGLIKEQKDLKEKPLEQAIEHAGRASERYGNVLVIDDEHVDAQERKKIVDQIKRALEQKKQQEEKKKEQDKQQQDDKKDDKKNKDDKQDQNKQDQNDQQNKSGDNDQNQKDNKQDQQDNKDQKKQDQKQDQQQSSDKKSGQDKPQQQSEQDKKQQQDQKKEQSGSEQQQNPDQQEQADQDEQKSAEQKEKEAQQSAAEQAEQKRAEEAAAAEQEQEEGDKKGEQRKGYALNKQQPTDMAQRRGLVLLDKLEQQESALQKKLLQQKSAKQQSRYQGYNQW